MKTSRLSLVAGLAITLGSAASGQSSDSPRYRPTPEELAAIETRTVELGRWLDELRSHPPIDPGHPDDLFADVAVFHKAAIWIVRHGEFFKPSYVAMTRDALETGLARAREALQGRAPWRSRAEGSNVRGYVSKVDGSVQPYAVVVPTRPRDAGSRYRLDVILHGRDANLTEVSFLQAHEGKPARDDEPGLILHIFGRTNNAYRWAGEADVFEAIDAVKREFPVDGRRILLRGFSMGGAGAWHLGLHHPDLWCAVEAGAGFVDTIEYQSLREEQIPADQRKGLHIYDAVDYALNAASLPVAGYGGELDKQLRASTRIREELERLGFAMTTEGLVTRGQSIPFLQVVGAQTAHKVDPASAALLKTFRDTHAERGQVDPPGAVRFVTYTLKFHRAPGLSVERLHEHYRRATVTLTPDDDRQTLGVTAENVAVLGIERRLAETVRLDGQEFPLRPAVDGLLPRVYFRHTEAGWQTLDYDASRDLQENVRIEKAPGLQGPIDDAFTGPFLCVRGTREPWNADVQRWADARLAAFAALWNRYFRGDLPVKDDTAVTAEDIEGKNLILFGDPGSNRLLERWLNRLPLEWSRQEFALGGRHAAAVHAPVLIAPNPENPRRYVVLNSGHTFDARALAGSNAQLYPRMGDWAVVRLAPEGDTVAASGFLDEQWKPASR